MTPGEYAQAVRDALADLPEAERDELLEDLDDHLADIAAESETPLEERLGSPEAYAAELRAAYEPESGNAGAGDTRPSPARRGQRRGLRRGLAGLPLRAHERMLGLTAYRQAVAFLPDLRPAWWVFRGYALAVLGLSLVEQPQIVPSHIVGWLFALGAIWISVWLGMRTMAGEPRSRSWRAVLFITNAAAALALLSGVAMGAAAADEDGYPGFSQDRQVALAIKYESGFGGEVYNIVPYAADGTPLHGVRLYDQDGRPIRLQPEMYGYMLTQTCGGEPTSDSTYPLPLTRVSEMLAQKRTLIQDGKSVPMPDPSPACLPAAPAPTPAPSPAPTPSPSPSAG
ncbi:hypothetical protein J5X84_32120 [Streptosporangiaceae bacterium NEAU-GS5]|nr:hypothetical protein [Streptosporangiaceae bacterium NEAU-GS5]